MKPHYKEIDVLKGIAIAMVILGHSIIVYPIDLHTKYPWCNYLHFFVSSAHMPLFFAVSGFCFSFSDWRSFLYKKSRRILIPYLFISLSGVFVNAFFSAYINGPKSPGKALIGIFLGTGNWFLGTLFLIFLIFPFIKNVYNKPRNGFILTCLLGVFQLFDFWPNIFNTARVLKYIFYFSLGYYFKMLSKKNTELWGKIVGGIKQVLIWAISLVLWSFMVFWLIKLSAGSYTLYAIASIGTALVGMINIVSFVGLISAYSFSRLFEETGKVSLQLFLLNGYFLTITRTVTVRMLHVTSPVIIVAANVFTMYFVSYAFIHLIIKKVKLFRVLTGMV